MVELRRLQIVDWEPANLCFHFSREDSQHAARVQDYFVRWFQQNKVGESCACSLVFMKVWALDSNSVVALCEWLCENCVGAFIDGLSKALPELDRVELGLTDEPVSVSAADAFVEVPAQEVEFEDGRRVFVNAFEVSCHPISVSQYEAFVQATGYRTMAEREGSFDLFNQNSRTHGLGKIASRNVPAVYLSLFDCLAYCRWARVRMPTEAEWLAASIADARLYTYGAYINERFPLRKDRRFLKSVGTEWTGTFDASGKAVVRSGPRWARTNDWKEREREHRGPLDPKFYDVMTTFRVVR